ncbi:LysE family translocator [uncultured Tateyamaria sp.]|uniref:LysE family translocator n=1 Tax=uncultured Tateyamaria sp. TaxID=455651 RepID=UPI002615CF28|nr:LysE family translocator [uncultured Tateyamaria sp.]
MDAALLIAFVTTTLIFVAIPGPSVAFATAQALRHGSRAAYITVAGDALGSIVHIAIAASSLAALIALSDIILPPLQICGGLFILYMAYQSLRAARLPETHSATRAPTTKAGITFWAGFFACVSNPKAIVFFVALFPAFISPDHSVLVQSIVYGAIFVALDAASILGFALFTLHAVQRSAPRWLNMQTVSGMGLAGVGLAMIIKGYRALPNT